jgi:hypothetical protein
MFCPRAFGNCHGQPKALTPIRDFRAMRSSNHADGSTFPATGYPGFFETTFRNCPQSLRAVSSQLFGNFPQPEGQERANYRKPFSRNLESKLLKPRFRELHVSFDRSTVREAVSAYRAIDAIHGGWIYHRPTRNVDQLLLVASGRLPSSGTSIGTSMVPKRPLATSHMPKWRNLSSFDR